jgi:homoserine dehydrogenase
MGVTNAGTIVLTRCASSPWLAPGQEGGPTAPGTAAGIATRMAEADISLESIVQKRSEIAARSDPKGRSGQPVPVVLITCATTEGAIRAAVEKVMADGHIAEPPQVIRIERD